MKEYRLKCIYPSLPKDWKVDMIVGLGDRNYGYSPCAGNYSDYRRPNNSEVEDNPEFWEEVKEKTFEILSFRNKENNLLYTLNSGRYKTQNIDGFTDLGDRDLNYCLKYYEITSVRRLFDGEVFKLGDSITYKSTGNRKVISGLFCVYNGIRINHPVYGSDLIFAEKLKTPLFTTIDGVDMFGGIFIMYLK